MYFVRKLRPLLAVLILFAGPGCSENFGVAPPDGGRRIAVSAEQPTGPARTRAVLGVALGGGRVFAGTDGGLFAAGLEGSSSTWSAVHPGFLGGDGFERVASVDAVASDVSGQLVLHVARVTPVYALVCSRDGGRTHEALELPDPVLTSVDGVDVIGPSALWPRGAWVAQQGTQVFVRGVEDSRWERLVLPQSPITVRRMHVLGDGRLALIVALPDADAVWTNALDAALAMTEATRSTRALFDATFDGSEWMLAHSEGIDRGDTPWVRWPGHGVVAARLIAGPQGVQWTLVGRDARQVEHIATGKGTATVDASTVLEGVTSAVPVAVVADRAALVVRANGADRVVLVRAGSVAPVLDERSARFVEVDARAITILDPVSGTIAVGSEFAGEVFAGPASDPEAFSQLGIGPLSSLVTALTTDGDGRVVAGSFGVHRFDPALARWQTQNEGQFTYQPGDFGGPVVVRALHRDTDGALWLGADNGDGVYRGTDAGVTGLVWERLHEGFGTPGTFAAEFGLPLVTQARAFARDAEGHTWMGGFRGGAWRLDAGAGTWRGANEGLPDVSGAAYDSCCVRAGEREVDVRDLVALGDGTLLAATAWGIYAREAGADQWQDRSLGLGSSDVFALAVHPRRGQTVAAGVAAAAPGRDGRWLYLSEDGGRTWFPVDVATLARDAVDLVWSRPDRMELVALLRGRGALRVELAR
jgi:hypothetical protein